MENVLTKEEALKIDAYFRATNYLSVGQLYLLDNPLLKRPLEKSDIKRTPEAITASGVKFCDFKSVRHMEIYTDR